MSKENYYVWHLSHPRSTKYSPKSSVFYYCGVLNVVSKKKKRTKARVNKTKCERVSTAAEAVNNSNSTSCSLLYHNSVIIIIICAKNNSVVVVAVVVLLRRECDCCVFVLLCRSTAFLVCFFCISSIIITVVVVVVMSAMCNMWPAMAAAVLFVSHECGIWI